MDAQSVAEVSENDLAHLLYRDPMFRAKILPHDCGEHWYRMGVPFSSFHLEDPTVQGEVDLIVIPTNFAPNATAIEFKRIKVTPSTFATGRANKIREVRKLALQANRLVDIGFHRVGASILVLVDARSETTADRWFLESPEEARREIDAMIAEASFSAAVMLDVLEIRQPDDVDFRLRGSTTRRPIHRGESRPQRERLSSALIQLFELESKA